MRAKLWKTLILQAIGAAATVGTGVVISRRYGPLGQGYLSYYRSLIDLSANLAMFGFPQAFVFFITAGRITTTWAKTFTFRYTFILTAIGGSAALACILYRATFLRTLGTAGTVAIVVGFSGTLIHGLFRALCLCQKPTIIYNLVSVMPSLGVFLIYQCLPLRQYQLLLWAPAIAFILSSAVSIHVLKAPRSNDGGLGRRAAVGLGTLATFGFWSFVVNASSLFVTALSYAALRRTPGGDGAVGQFSLSYLILASTVLPLTFMSPILFNSWSSAGSRTSRWAQYTALAHLSLPVAMLALAVGFAGLRPLVAALFGEKFAPSVASTLILLASVYPLYHNRMMGTMQFSLGRARDAATCELVRTALISLPLISGRCTSLYSVAVVWVVAEFASATFRALTLRPYTDVHISAALGLSIKEARVAWTLLTDVG